VGGALASLATSEALLNTGTHIMVAGLSFQVFSLLLFMALAGEFFIKIRLSGASFNPAFVELRAKKHFKMFIHMLPIATLCIFTRCVYRVAELSKGFSGTLFRNEEVTLMILEGTLISVASIALTVGHPGIAFRDLWKTVTKGGERNGESVIEMSEEGIAEKK
jgi:RTA1 like protein